MIGSDPKGRLGEAPRPELREHGRISGACFDAARGIMPGLKVCYSFYPLTLLIFSDCFVFLAKLGSRSEQLVIYYNLDNSLTDVRKILNTKNGKDLI